MITLKEKLQAQQMAAKMIKLAGVVIKDEEESNIEIVDFGLSRLKEEGVQVLTLYATERTSAKILVLFPNQTEPEHWHPPVGNDPGKEEIIRAIKGTIRFYIPGDDNMEKGFIPNGKDMFYTCRNEVILNPGDQLILKPGTKHWFQAGDDGAVMYSFSTCVRDGLDKFSDPDIIRKTIIKDKE